MSICSCLTSCRLDLSASENPPILAAATDFLKPFLLFFISETCVLLPSFLLSWVSLPAFGLRLSPSRLPRAENWPSPPRGEAKNHPPHIGDRSRMVQCYCKAGRYYRFPVVSPDSACVFLRAELTRRPDSLNGNHVRFCPFGSFDNS